jgi:hypothetical protein
MSVPSSAERCTGSSCPDTGQEHLKEFDARRREHIVERTAAGHQGSTATSNMRAGVG